MRLVFDPALDGAGWPGPLGDRDAVSGEAWLGPLGLLGVLETQLGLGGRAVSPLERACRLARTLRQTDGFWRTSFDRDSLGTSRRLLADRDTLAMWGWQGQPVSPRLAELQRITADTEPGLPDRLAQVVQALGRRSVDIASLSLFSPRATMEPLWQAVLTALANAGVSIEEHALPTAPARGDLAHAQTAPFLPTGDGSLCLLRRHGVLDTADEVAATLAALDDLKGVVIIGADATLDRALARQGLPTVGRDTMATASSHLIALIGEAAFDPMEPEDLHALLMADPGPVPRALAAFLVRALQTHPGRKSQGWVEALARGLESYPQERRDELSARVTALLMPAVPHGTDLPVATLRARLQVARSWAQARCPTVPSLAAVCQQADSLDEALDLRDEPQLSRADLRRLCSDLGAVDWVRAPGEAGLGHVDAPGAILGPARTIIWWNFTRDHAPHLRRFFLTEAEERGLRDVGVTSPDFALLMKGEAQRWRRPLSLATDALVLVCPRSNESGELNQIHPLWDELTASLARFEDAATLEVQRLDKLVLARTLPTTLRPLPKPVSSVSLSTPVQLRDVESPSSLERLIGCSLSWALHYRGDLKEGLSRSPALMTPLLLSTIAHDLLAQVFAQKLRDADLAATSAAELFEREVPKLCEAIGLPRYQVERATLKRAVVESARVLTRLVVDAGAQIVGTEMSHGTMALGQRVEGHLDLVLSSPDFVVDLKWGKATYRNKLQTGTAIQLAAYASMRRSKCADPQAGVGIAYFTLLSQEFLSGPEATTLGGGYAPGQHGADVMWQATLDQLKHRQTELGAGLLLAPGASGEDAKSMLDGTTLRLAPACGYCSFGGLCGRLGAR